MEYKQLGRSGLKVSRLDLYQMHHIDRSTPWEEIWQAMEQLVREGKALYVASTYVEEHRPQFEAYEAFCAELGERPAAVALAWLLHQPAVTAPIIGPRTLDQLTASQRAVELDLSADALRRLDEIWPGPGGEAPEAYAW